MKFSASGWFGGDWYDNVRAASRYGFKGIEQLGWDHLDTAEASATLKSCGIVNTAVVLGTKNESLKPYLEWSHGIVWDDTLPHISAVMRETAEFCKACGVPNVVVTTGNVAPGYTREHMRENVVKALKIMAPIAEEYGLQIVLEPLNTIVDHKSYFLSKSSEAFDIIREVDSPCVKVLFDIYHQQITEGNIIRNIRENIDLIGHFHIADNPGRCQPGTGEICYENVLRAIKDVGYNGWLAFECGTTVDIDTLCSEMHKLTDQFE